MNKTELVASMAEKVSYQKMLKKHLMLLLKVLEEGLAKGEKIQLVGFGTFEVRERAERKGRNPQTKEEIIIPATKAPVFKVGKI